MTLRADGPAPAATAPFNRRIAWRAAVPTIFALLLVACGGGGSGGGSPSSPSSVTVSGKATYERVPFSSNVSLGLSYASTTAQPIREAVVELIQSGGGTLTTTTTDSNGNYALTAPANTSVFVRVKAQSKYTAFVAVSPDSHIFDMYST